MKESIVLQLYFALLFFCYFWHFSIIAWLKNIIKNGKCHRSAKAYNVIFTKETM